MLRDHLADGERFGRADVLVANAGFGVLDRIADAPIEDLQAMIDVNLIGTIRCVKALLPSMLQHRSGQAAMHPLRGNCRSGIHTHPAALR